jgi:hypothetical protein
MAIIFETMKRECVFMKGFKFNWGSNILAGSLPILVYMRLFQNFSLGTASFNKILTVPLLFSNPSSVIFSLIHF